MALDRPKVFRSLAVAGLLGFATLGPADRAPAQDHTPDPYRPYNSGYDQFIYPTYPNGVGLVPNQNVLEGRSGFGRANRFQDYLDGGDSGLGGDLSVGGRRTGPGVPYYSSYRRYDRDYDRVYQPNQTSDQDYYRDQQARHDKYLEYLRERDPKRRAQLYREYTRDSQKASRDLSAPRGTLSRSGASNSSAPRSTTAPGLGRGSSAPGLGRNPAPATGSGPATPRAGILARPSAGGAPPPSATLRRSEEMDQQNRTRPRTAPGLGSGPGSRPGRIP